MDRDKNGRFLKGHNFGIKTRIKKGQRLSPKTEIKIGQRLSRETEFKRGKDHPCYKHGYFIKWRTRSRKIMENHLGRKLTSKEVLHHVDGNIKNMRIDNMILFKSQSAHVKFHHMINGNKRLYKGGG